VVTQWQPPGRLGYTWNVYNPGDATSPYPESYLILTLAAAVEGTLPTLDHLPVLEKFVKLNAMGWHTFVDMVDAAVRGEAVHDRTPIEQSTTKAAHRQIAQHQIDLDQSCDRPRSFGPQNGSI
jgi:hypothetical protein